MNRYWVRWMLFVVMIGLIGFAFYQMSGHQKPGIGDTAPFFTLTTLEGKQRSLHDSKGKVVILNFWGTWCEPCRQEMPVIQKMYETYHDKGLEVIAVNIAETAVSVSSFVQQVGITFPIWMDTEQEVMQLYGVGSIPSTFVIDPTGVIRYKIQGRLEVSQFERYIHPMLP
jgi:peroxiredoxin